MFLGKIFIINMYFIIGYVLKKLKILKEEDGNVLLKMAFYVFLPAILFQSIRSIEFTIGYAAYPIIILVVELLLAVIVITFLKMKKVEPKKLKIIAGYFTMTNIGFLYPFFIYIFGETNVWRLGLLDFGNSIFIYAISYSYIVGANRKRDLLKKVFLAPGIIALILALICNYFGVRFFEPVEILLDQLGELTGFSMIFALGLFFNFKFGELKSSMNFIIIKEIIKLILLVIVFSLDIEYYTRSAFLLVITAPIASSLMNFSLFAKLDTKYVSKLISLSMLISFIEIPVVIYILNLLY